MGKRKLTPGEVLCQNGDRDVWKTGHAAEPTCPRCLEHVTRLLDALPAPKKKKAKT